MAALTPTITRGTDGQKALASQGMTTPYDPQSRQPEQLPSASSPSPSGYPGPMSPVGGAAPVPSGPVVSRPKEVEISFGLWVTSVVIGLISSVIFVSQFDSFRGIMLEEMRRQSPGPSGALDESRLDTIVTVVFVVALAIMLIITLVQLLFAFFMRKGRNWARIVLAVIGGILVLVGIPSLLGVSGGQLLLTLVSLLVVLGAIVTMFLPGAHPWFRPHLSR